MALSEILLDAATATQQPSPFAVNTALRNAGINNLKVYEMLDRKLHVRDDRASVRRWAPLDNFVLNLID